MAKFKNPHPDNFKYSGKEDKFLEILCQLPEEWEIWHEPKLHGGLTPDFVIWLNDVEHPGIIIIELKNWLRKYVKSVTSDNIILSDHREEYNPIPKLKRVKENLNEALSKHYRMVPGLQDLAIVPILCFWDEHVHKMPELLQGDIEVNVFGKDIAKDHKKVEAYFSDIIKNYYAEVEVQAPVTSIDMKRTLRQYIDLSTRVSFAQGKISDPRTHKADDKHKKPIISTLDKYQERMVFKEQLGHQVLSGVSGTGKTIILLARANWFARQFPKERQLFIVNQMVLCNNLRQKYRIQYSNSQADTSKIQFKTFGKWFKSAYKGVGVVLNKAKDDQDAKVKLIDTLVEKALDNKLELAKNGKYGAIFIDEAHQMHTSWIKLLTKFAISFPTKQQKSTPNIWISYDNGQGIYRDRKFIGKEVGLDLRGRTHRLQRVYRCGMMPWIFAACCYPASLETYRDHSVSEYLEFVRKGAWPKAIIGDTLQEQASKLKELIKNFVNKENYKFSDVTIFYAVAGYNQDLPTKNQRVKSILDKAFDDVGGIEWVAINKERANWSSNRVRACSFTSSQGIDAPISVFFGAESFDIFNEDSWVKPGALFYTVLTRSTDVIIITYKELKNDPNSPFLSALFNGYIKAKEIKDKVEKLNYVYDEDGNSVYRVKWETFDSFINKS
ncbi:NERD domain-containing protein/DEAD/DEAH box helicase [Thiotrichales bacterium HSG1]|nr:NERD domain-containing protein/DEAD/DEAH box helicase [Thiotrichales bacterium HSG1]